MPTARPRIAAGAWLAGAPIIALALAGIVLPFVLRAAGLATACGGEGACPFSELVSDAYYLQALLNTLGLSLVSTLIALPIALGCAVVVARHARMQGTVQLVAGIGANFAGVPLALGLAILFGAQGVFTVVMRDVGVELPIALHRPSGLLLAYVCFQVPLATLLLLEPVRLLEASLWEAAVTLGVGEWRFWQRVGLPVLATSLIETGTLLFANAAAAYATPFALAGTGVNVLSVRIAALVSGDIFADPQMSALLALVMAAVLIVSLMFGRWLAHRVRVQA